MEENFRYLKKKNFFVKKVEGILVKLKCKIINFFFQFFEIIIYLILFRVDSKQEFWNFFLNYTIKIYNIVVCLTYLFN